MDEDRRGAVRWKVALPVRYCRMDRHSEGACRTADLSLTGARLAMVEKHRAGDSLRMMLELPGSSKGPVPVEADVVWQNGENELSQECNYLTGIMFRKIRDYQKEWILDFVNTNCFDQMSAHWWNGLK